MKILVLGASGMLGNAVFRFFNEDENYEAFGTLRSEYSKKNFPISMHSKLMSGIDVENIESLMRAFSEIKPELVINCIGLVKQLTAAEDPLIAIPINSLLPHRLAMLCAVAGSRFVHMSTDCVFSGSKGMYLESDIPDARDLYGQSKFLGEVDYPHAITLRTSIIGHELEGGRSLVGWFLAQEQAVKGYKNAIFSGLPTVEIARLIRDYVIPNPHLHGLYHVSANPISKFDLLKMISKEYGRKIEINPDFDFVIDRSLDSGIFRSMTGFLPKTWPELIHAMRIFH
ncbi:SDR family oxidoreductase [Comamonas sp. Y33R10-2]|uniref:dTDP-4-dehydrorhamnose reductase family protein n=1 Tax=Comamonas sp. Y33R10-2 TaxID=2853257 RepID=UPI001C5CA72D|nr:SDR family oxidoreductase [Comamonas sp. Y33R10-2]QXZ09313.1 SDR family oxidoreductase [Comamonas sp. Y33R10-2]